MREAKPLAPPARCRRQGARQECAGALLGDVETRRLVFVDGAFVAELSDLASLESGLTVGSLAEALSGNDPVTHAASRQARAGRRRRGRAQYRVDGRRRGDPHRRRRDHRAAAASVVRGVRKARRELSCARSSSSKRGARAMVIESHEGPAGSDYQVNAALELFVGDAAHVDHVKIIGEGADALHVSTLAAAIGAHARFNSFSFTAGGAVVRNQLFLKFDGEGTVAGIRGAIAAQGPPARRHHAGRHAPRARLPEPRSLQERARRRGPWRVPGPHHRAAAGAEDRRQDDDAGAALVGARRSRQQAGARDLRRRRAVRPRRHGRRASTTT